MGSHKQSPLLPRVTRPHVVILGAGASRAAFPNGDANGRAVPLMDDLASLLELNSLFASFGLELCDSNFETLYSSLSISGHHPQLIAQIEERVFEYFAGFELPDEMTLYDRLVLSLRPKDLIATFNWDPFLWKALNRNAAYAEMPKAVHLHGNVAVGHCTRHTPISEGWRHRECRRCGAQFVPSRLLFPVADKNYTSDPAISAAWQLLESDMKSAFLLTIFGYRLPDTDLGALEFLRKGWGNKYNRDMEEIEVIDVRDEDELRQTWSDLIHTHHYHVVESFAQSVAGQFPRRSCEAEVERLIEANENLLPLPMPDGLRRPDGRSWVMPFLDAESEFDRATAARKTAVPLGV